VFTVGHLEYLHEDAYPRLHDLPASARHRLLSAPIYSLRDTGSDPQIFPIEGDRIDLINWKVQNVQHVITEEIQKSGFLSAQNHNRLVILADHGVRTGINNDNFADEKYYRVPLITFGVPTRDVTKPISLLDHSSIVGMDDPSSPGPADAAVEFAVWATHVQYAEDIRSAEWTVDGRVNLSKSVANKYWSQLKIYDPYGLRSIGNIGETRVSQTRSAGEHEVPEQVTGIAGGSSIPAR